MSAAVSGIIGSACLAVIARFFLQVAFYRAYFRQKQHNAGRNPDDILRQEFGWFWRLMQ
jgi:hypothetical protein